VSYHGRCHGVAWSSLLLSSICRRMEEGRRLGLALALGLTEDHV
jgi:hypothetical protein